MSRHNAYRMMLLIVVVITLFGLPAAAGAAGPNGVTSIKDGAKVSGKLEIKGMADDPAFSRWQLDLLPGGKSDAAIFLATDTKSGEFSYTLDTTRFPDGEHALRLRVVKPDGNYNEYITKLVLANAVAKSAATPAAAPAAAPVTATVATTATVAAKPAAAVTTTVATTPTVAAAPAAVAKAATPANGITSIKDGAKVSGKAEIKGIANDPAFSKWQLDLLPGGKSDAAIFLATDTKPGEFSYTLDTARFPDGEHALRLRVVKPDGNYNEYIIKFTVANKPS